MKKRLVNLSIVIFALFFSFAFYSCMTVNGQRSKCSIYIDDDGIKTEKQLIDYFMYNNPKADRDKVTRLACYYIMECNYEGINSDIAFVQMCHETGFLTFGNLVTVDMNNFCGLGAIDANNRGLSFQSEQMGVKAHVQHLHSYGTKRKLKGECIDPRYKYVQPRGKAPTVFDLAGTWAADREYGNKLNSKLQQLSAF